MKNCEVCGKPECDECDEVDQEAWRRYQEALDKGKYAPPPPSSLVGALQDRVHTEGKLLRAIPVNTKTSSRK